MEKFSKLPDEERKEYIEQVARSHSYSNIIIEKDFWVCWALKHLCLIKKLGPYIIFKGGTSLSKAYGLIDRFSEDVDITISKEAPCFIGIDDPSEENISGKEKNRRLKRLKEETTKVVIEDIKPLLERQFANALNKNTKWEIEVDESDADKQTLLFNYPKIFDYRANVPFTPKQMESANRYILPRVKLEFGARGGVEPTKDRAITSYIATDYPSLFETPSCTVKTLSAERTFWEKITILHGLFHGIKLKDAMFRHYYDIYKMAYSPTASRAIVDVSLLDRVVCNNQLYFNNKKASYDTAKIGSLRLAPNDDIKEHLRSDYEKMKDEGMFAEETPDFDEIMTGIANLEKRING